MARGSFGRTVARAASSGGSRSYRARPPALWYLLMIAIVVVGVGLIAYSRNEALHPAAAKVGPSLTDNWQAALGIDICGTIKPNLPVSTNLASTGIRTFGNGLIDAAPDVSSSPAKFEGAKATLGLFAKNYAGFTLTATESRLPGQTREDLQERRVVHRQAERQEHARREGVGFTHGDELEPCHRPGDDPHHERRDDHRRIRPIRHDDPSTVIEGRARNGDRNSE